MRRTTIDLPARAPKASSGPDSVCLEVQRQRSVHAAWKACRRIDAAAKQVGEASPERRFAVRQDFGCAGADVDVAKPGTLERDRQGTWREMVHVHEIPGQG